MSGEHAETALNLTPVRGTWREVLSKIFTNLEVHNRLSTVPKTGCWVTVDPNNRFIIRREAAIDLEGLTMRDDAVGQESWSCVIVDIRIGRDRFKVQIFLRNVDRDKIAVEFQLPSYVYESVYKFDPDENEIDEAVKFDLIRFCVETSAALSAEGFGYDYTLVHKVLGPPSIQSLVQWVDNDPNRVDIFPEQWILAGVLSSRISVEQLRSRDGLHAHVYERRGFTIYDLLWPSVLNE